MKPNSETGFENQLLLQTYGMDMHNVSNTIITFSGLSTESTVKILKNLEKEGLIALSEKNIGVLNRPKLEEISRIG